MAQQVPAPIIMAKAKEEALLTLMENTGFNIVQENGQRLFGPNPNWTGPPPAKGSEVFVGKLPRDLYEDELVPVFERIGTIFQIRLMMDFSGTNRGFAFVTYCNTEDAKKAVSELDNFEIRKSKFIGVCKSVDNCRLFVGGIPKTKSKLEILGEMEKVTEGVVDVILYPSVADKSKNRGFAFVEYENHRSAAMARRKLIPGKIQLWGHEIAVDWAEPEPEVDEATMSKVTVLYVRNLMLNTTEEQIADIFSMNGAFKVEKVKKLRDFAFVHFRSREEAKQALTALNDQEVDGSRLEVSWAKPADRANKKNPRNTPGQVVGTPYAPVLLGNQYDIYGYSPQYAFAAATAMPNMRGRSRGAAGMRYFRGGSQVYSRGYNSYGRKPTEPHFIDLQPTMELVPTNPYTLKPARSSIQVLLEVCQKNSWGEPTFQLMSTTLQHENVQYFFYKITIPDYPAYNEFTPPKGCRCPEEAKQYSAEWTLGQIGVPLEGFEMPPPLPGTIPMGALPPPTAFEPGFYQAIPQQHIY